MVAAARAADLIRSCNAFPGRKRLLRASIFSPAITGSPAPFTRSLVSAFMTNSTRCTSSTSPTNRAASAFSTWAVLGPPANTPPRTRAALPERTWFSPRAAASPRRPDVANKKASASHRVVCGEGHNATRRKGPGRNFTQTGSTARWVLLWCAGPQGGFRRRVREPQ
jgi:hypothetical protein